MASAVHGLSPLGPVAQLRAGRLTRRLVQLLVGLVLFGATMALMVRAGLGLAPWDVLTFGIMNFVPLSFGTITVLMSVVVLLAWIPLRQAPGLGTIANALIVGVAADATLRILPAPETLPVQIGLLVTGIVGNGIAGALYIGAQLGPGPRDGLMTGLARRTGRSLRLVRTAIEVSVVAAGFALGGPVGIGTLLYALSIGPLVQVCLPRVLVALPGPDVHGQGPRNADAARV